MANGADVEITNPQTWRLALRINDDCVRFAAYSEVGQGSLISREVPLDGSGDDFLRSLENCIYDNPLFLLDYNRVVMSFTSQHFMLVPGSMSDDSAIDAFNALFGSVQGDILVDTLPRCGVKIVFELPAGVLRFINRTFESATIHHHLWALCEHFAAKCANAGVCREYVYLHDGTADVCIFSHGKLNLANSYVCHSVDDAAFFTLNAWKCFGLSVDADELQMLGDRTMRDALAPVLRNYITYVMPAIFPAASMRMGHDAMKAPYDLILLLLCE